MRRDVCVSLDVNNLTWALHVVRATEDVVWGYKVGLRLIMMYGLRVVLSNLGETRLPVVLDLKLHDIPSTTRRNCELVQVLRRDLTAIGELYVTAHPDSIIEDSPVPQLCVTSLTSRPLGNVDGVKLAQIMGAAGVVCSGREASKVRKVWPKAQVFCPGVRLLGAEAHDQTRVCTPQAAREGGADVLIVGRPVYEAKDPAAAVRSLL